MEKVAGFYGDFYDCSEVANPFKIEKIHSELKLITVYDSMYIPEKKTLTNFLTTSSHVELTMFPQK